MRGFLASVYLILSCGLIATKAQNAQKSDSLLSVLAGVTDDSTKFEVFKLIAFNHPSPVQSLRYANEALVLSREMDHPINTARALEEVSLSHRTLGNKVQSLEAAFSALRIYDSLRMDKHRATQYIQIGSNYTLEKDFKRAITYLLKGRQIHSSLGRDYQVAVADVNIGETYRLMGNLDSGLWHTNRALAYGSAQGDSQLIGYATGNLGIMYAEDKKYPEARDNLLLSLDIMQELGDYYSLAVYLSELAEVYEQLGNDQKCLKLLNKAYRMASQNDLKEPIKDISFQLADFFEKRQFFEDALHYSKISEAYEDSLVNLENVKSIEQLKAQYEYEKKDQEIARKQAEVENGIYVRNISLVITGLLIVIVLISFLAVVRKSKDNKLLALQKEQIAERESQKQWLLGELQHRTKNNLQMISSLLSLQSRQLVGHPSYDMIKTGQSRVDALAIIHQRLYHEGSQLKINLKEYLTELVESLVYSFDSGVALRFQIEAVDLAVDKAIPLALVVNELVTNALKHAYNLVEKPQLWVRFGQLADGSVSLEIADNGCGIKDPPSYEGNSFGLRLVHTLVAQLKATMVQKTAEKGCLWEINLGYNVISPSIGH